MYDKSQMMRGTLEGCILKIISIEATYGYEIVMKLQEYGFEDVKEGTIYPLLMRLEKKEYISSEFRSSPLGPSRKYFSLTDHGRQLLKDFTVCWQSVAGTVNTILDLEEQL
jgi:PadR family transcriptional regulator PadR